MTLGIFKVNTDKFKTDLTELEIIGLRVTAFEYLNEHFEDTHGEKSNETFETAYTSSGWAMLNFMYCPVITVEGVTCEVSFAVVLGESRVVLGAYAYNDETGEFNGETIYISN